MHILKVIHGFPPKYNAGSEVYSQSICIQLSQKHTVSIFTREENVFLPDYNIRQEEIGGIQFYYVNMARAKDGYLHTAIDQKFKSLVQTIKPDVVHIGHLNHLSVGIVNILEELNIPIVFTLHDFWLMCPRGQFLQTNFASENFYQLCNGQEDRKCAENCYSSFFSGIKENRQEDIAYWSRWVYNRMEFIKQIVKKINLFIAPSKYLMNRFIHDFHIEKDKIIYLDYGFPIQYLKPIQANQKNKIYTLGYIGTHIPAKGVNLLIHAFLKIKLKAKLKIWGRENGQNTASLKEIIRQSDSANSIEWMGEYINQNISKEVFSNVDVIVVPSIWSENSPLVIHEAQSCQIPVITADFGGMSEYVQHNVNGLLFEHRNILDLTEKIEYAICNPDKMRAMGKRGYLFSEDGTVPNIVEHCNQLEMIYKSIK